LELTFQIKEVNNSTEYAVSQGVLGRTHREAAHRNVAQTTYKYNE